MYGTLLLMCMTDLFWVQRNVDESKRTNPPVAIAVPLDRVARPLAVLCNELFGDQVKVLTHHSIRGLSVNVVHGLRHRRWIDAEDQFQGVQEDPERDYMVLTRGKDKTVMWLEVQPFGQPDPRLKGKGKKAHKGKSSKGTQGKGSNKQLRAPEYAMRLNKVISETWSSDTKWYDLGESNPKNFSADWYEKFDSLFPSLGTPFEAECVQAALCKCWNMMVSGQADVPKGGQRRRTTAKTRQPCSEPS